MKKILDRKGPLEAGAERGRVSRRGFGKLAGGIFAAGLTTPFLNTRLFAQASPADTLRISTNADAEILDPNFLLSDVELRLCEMMFNGLVSIDENLNIIPDLAESWTVSDDARVYEFNLRRGVKFHHGCEFDAGDVAFTFERFKESWVGSVVADLKSVEVVDSHTVRLTFGEPAAHFLGSIAPRWCAIVPADVVREVGNDAFKLKPVGTGAYRFVEHVPSQRLVMERFVDYFETGRPVIERLEWIPIQDDVTRVLQVSAGEIDLDLWAPLRSIPDLEAAAGVKVLGGPTTRYEFAELNNARAPFDNPKIRQAVALATDRQAIVDFVLAGRGEPTNGGAIGPKGNPFFNDLTVYGAPDIDKAKALLAEAGLSGGITVDGVAPGGSRYSEVLEVLQQQWAAVGVTINITAIEAGAARARRNEGDYDLFINGWGTMIDPNDFIGEQFLRTGGLNLGKAGDDKLDELLLAGKREPDLEKRKAIYREAEEYILNTLHPMVFLYRPFNFAAYRERLEGIRHEAGNTYYACLAVRADPSKASARQQRDAVLRPKIQKVWDDNWKVYGVRKAWRQLCREGEAAARCTVARLMASMGLRGIVRGKAMKTTIPDTSVACPRDKVNRKFRAPEPNMLWVSDFTYVSTWQGFVYVAFVIDTFANRIVGWKASQSAKTDFVLDALEQALYARRPAHQGGLIHHSDRGSQYVSIRYTERLGKAGIEPSVGSVGDAYDNALAETINGLYKTEVIRRRSSWKTMEQVELETLKWVDWFNNRRLLEPIGNIPPAEAEEAFYANLNTLDMVA